MKKGFLSILLVLALVVVMAPVASANNLQTFDLIAGNPKNGTEVKVGVVNVTRDATHLYVEYLIQDPTPADPRDDWWITEVHVEVVTNPENFPQKNGNPIPGKFTYSRVFDPAVQGLPGECILEIPIPAGATAGVYIAAHAAVEQLGGLEALAYSLPPSVTMSVTYPYTGGPAYFGVNVTNGGFLNGSYLGWCVDTDHVIYQNTPYTANVYSSFEAAAAGLVSYPLNFDLVNWIINQGFVGTPSPFGTGVYTYGDVQRAIWELLEAVPSTSGLGPWSPARVLEIKNAAAASGEDFVPGCNQKVAVVLAPVGTTQVIIAQVVMFELFIPCEGRDETAWTGTKTQTGYVIEFLGRNWALYFLYAL